MAFRTAIEVVIGVLYALGAGAQALWVLRHSEKFYRDMADRAWLPPAEELIQRLLVPNSVMITGLVAVSEAALAIAILTRGTAAGPALVAGGVFSVIGALTGSPGETGLYGALAAVHFWLAAAH
ncbi:MAG: hypothetical protein GY926_08330 [bacterium]|nr:hypothetical protein [Actinomycetes bacterium]MCP4965230.1 hypothetical protein [bacterium]